MDMTTSCVMANKVFVKLFYLGLLVLTHNCSYLIITWHKINETVFILLDCKCFSEAPTYLVLFLYKQ